MHAFLVKTAEITVTSSATPRSTTASTATRSTTIAAAIALAVMVIAAPVAAHSSGEQRTAEQAHQGKPVALQAEHKQADQVIASWPKISRDVAGTMIDKYGEPDGVTEAMLVWHNNGPWVETILRRDPIQHNFPIPHQDVLAQTVYLKVPVDKFDQLAEYDGSVIVERTRGTITARCDKEGANFLALNLAHDIIDGSRSVEEARRHYARAIQAMMQDGEMDPYLQGLRFEPQVAARAGDTDQRSELIAMGDED